MRRLFNSRKKPWIDANAWKAARKAAAKERSHLVNFPAVHGATLIDDEDNVLRYTREIGWSKVMNKELVGSLGGEARKSWACTWINICIWYLGWKRTVRAPWCLRETCPFWHRTQWPGLRSSRCRHSCHMISAGPLLGRNTATPETQAGKNGALIGETPILHGCLFYLFLCFCWGDGCSQVFGV